MATARMKAENLLIAFVRTVAFMERTGNAIGRLVLIWASVVVGFSKKLGDHFGYLAVIIALESFRAFSRENISDDQLLFKTIGSIKVKRVSLLIGYLYYVNAMTITVCVFGAVVFLLRFFGIAEYLSDARLALGHFRIISDNANPVLLSLLVFLSKATILPKLIKKTISPGSSRRFKFGPLSALLFFSAIRNLFPAGEFILIGAALLAILSWCLLYYLTVVQLPAAHPWMQKYLRPVLVITIAGTLWWMFRQVAVLIIVAPLVLGNFQIPLSITRIELGFSLLLHGEYDDLDHSNKGTHVVQSLKALYIMLICQGILYILACLLESFSFFFRDSLALICGLVDKTGMKSIGLYYEHAYTTFVQESLLDKKMSIVTFAVDSLSSDVTPDKKLAAVKILNSFLQQDEEASNREVISQVTASTKAVTTLISMLGWTVPEGATPTEEKEVVKDADVRLFAARVVADLAPYLRVVGIPGTMQMVSSLLDAENKPTREDNLAQIVEGNGRTGDQEIRGASSPRRVDNYRGTADNQETEGNVGTGDREIRGASSPPGVNGNRGSADNQETEIQERSHAVDQVGDLEHGNADNQETEIQEMTNVTSQAGDPEQGNVDNQEIEIQETSSVASQAGDLEQGNVDNQEIELQEMSNAPAQAEDLEGNPDNRPPMRDLSAQAAGDSEGSSTMKDTCWQHYMKDIWSIPRDSLKDEDSIPVLGVLILERLAHDVDNCVEISCSTQILPKIIGFISHITNTTTVLQKQIVTLSLTLVAKIASVKGQIGVTILEYLSENHLLLSKLADILEDSCSGPEQWKPMMDITAKLAMNEKARQEIGEIKVIISKLMRIFLGRDESPNTRTDPSLRKAAGEALAMLAMDSADNCSAMLDEPGHDQLTNDLIDMLLVQDPDGEYVYLAAILLQNMCAYSGRNLPISSALPAVLDRIIKPDSEDKQLEALIGLASKIFTSITSTAVMVPDEGIPLEVAGVIAKKMVDELNANMRPSTEIPNMRRRLVELAISMLKSRRVGAEAFRNHGMLKALYDVERTPSKVERYRLFSGNVGLFPWREGDATLSYLVAEAKDLIEPAAQ